MEMYFATSGVLLRHEGKEMNCGVEYSWAESRKQQDKGGKRVGVIKKGVYGGLPFKRHSKELLRTLMLL